MTEREKELEAEIEELKNKYDELKAQGLNVAYMQLRKENTKAKEIIRDLIDTLEAVEGEQVGESTAVKRAEDFIKN